MSDKQKMLDEAVKTIEKQFGKWSIMKLGDSGVFSIVSTLHSWSYSLDSILGGGYPQWRVVEIYWPESSWKTTLALHAVAEAQKIWENVAFIDAEHALDPVYAKNLGVDVDNLLLSQPDYGEQWLQIAEELAKSGTIKLIVIDSVAALTPRSEIEWDMWDSFMWLQARMMSQAMRKLTSIIAKTWTTIIFINQIRLKIWIVFGNPETTTWGNALKFYASQRIEVRRWEKIEVNKEQTWYVAKIKVVKNKIAAPHRNTTIVVKYNKWFDKIQDLIEASINIWVIERNGAFYSIWDQKIQWREKLWQLIGEDKTLRSKLEKQVIASLKGEPEAKEKKEKKEKK